MNYNIKTHSDQSNRSTPAITVLLLWYLETKGGYQTLSKIQLAMNAKARNRKTFHKKKLEFI